MIKRKEDGHRCTRRINENCSEAALCGTNTITINNNRNNNVKQPRQKKIEREREQFHKKIRRYWRERIENEPINRRKNYELRGCRNTKFKPKTWFQMRLRTFEHFEPKFGTDKHNMSCMCPSLISCFLFFRFVSLLCSARRGLRPRFVFAP